MHFKVNLLFDMLYADVNHLLLIHNQFAYDENLFWLNKLSPLSRFTLSVTLRNYAKIEIINIYLDRNAVHLVFESHTMKKIKDIEYYMRGQHIMTLDAELNPNQNIPIETINELQNLFYNFIKTKDDLVLII